MNICVFLGIGESIKDFKKKGQDSLFVYNNLKSYSRTFDNVFVFSYENESYKFFKNVYVLPNKYKISRLLYCFILPFFYLKLIKSSIVIRGYQLTGGLPAVISKLLFNKKIVINYGYPYQQTALTEGRRIKAVLLKLLNYFILPFCDIIIITQKYLKNYLPKFAKIRSVVIPNGINTVIFRPSKAEKKFNIIFVGRLEPQKNIPVLLKAISLLPQNLRTLLIIGNGSLKEKIISECKNSQIQLKLLTKVQNRQLPLYLNSARIFVLPSIVEGHPKALLEAMGCSLAVVVNDIEAVKEVIIDGKNGLVFNGSGPDLASKTTKILNDSKLASQLGINARLSVKENYDFAKNSQLEISALKRIL